MTVLAWGINMNPRAIVKTDTHPTNKTLLLAIYFLIGDFAILFLFSASSFKLIKDASHSSDLVCW